MFWQSVISGLIAFLDWHIIIGAIGIAFASVLHLLITGFTMGDNESGGRLGAGCLLMFIGGPLVQALSVSVFILFCLPAIIGTGGFTPLELVSMLLWPVIKIGLIAFGIVFVLCIIPIIGDIITSTPGVTIFLQGIFMLRPITNNLFYAISDGEILPPSVFPSFLNSLGYVIIGIAICWGLLLIIAFIFDQVKKRRNAIEYIYSQYDSEPTIGMVFIGMFLGPIFGIIPLLMYGQYISFSLSAI